MNTRLSTSPSPLWHTKPNWLYYINMMSYFITAALGSATPGLFTISHRSRSYPFLMKKRSTSINFYRFSYTSTIPSRNSCCKVIQITSTSNIILKPFYSERMKIYSSGVKLKSAGLIYLWFPFLLLLSVFLSFPLCKFICSFQQSHDREEFTQTRQVRFLLLGLIVHLFLHFCPVHLLYALINWGLRNTNIMKNNRSPY